MVSTTEPLHARLSRRRWELTALALALSGGAAVLVGWWAGWSAVREAIAEIQPGWIALIVVLTPVAVLGYAVAYRAVARLDHGPEVSASTALQVVTAGFGPFVVAGGFAEDQRFLTDHGTPPRHARVLVLGLGAVEYGVLAPAAWACALILLATSAPGVQGALVWSWVTAVPIGFALGLRYAAPRYRERIEPRTRPRAWLRTALDAVGVLRELIEHPVRHVSAWVGMAMYWSAEIAMLYGALRLFGTRLGAAHVVLAYATGYALTRRSMPLGGAGATVVLMSLGLRWVGVGLATALPAVVAYRIANLMLPAIPAIRAHRRVDQRRRMASPEPSAARGGEAVP